MPAFICATCGTQFAPAAAPPRSCPVCEDERQFVPAGGQRWITLTDLAVGHNNAWRQHERDLLGIGTTPAFAIGQRALLVRTQAGNVLWDCVSLIDAASITLVRALGGVAAIAISHPHFYSSMVEWADAFGAEVWLHAADREWVMRPDPRIRFWSGEAQPLPGGLTLINAPGHFDGATMLHWPAGAEGRGALLSGDIIHVAADGKSAGFMRSYPNYIPLGAAAVARIGAAVAPFAFERVYGAWFDRVIAQDGKAAVERSVARALRWLRE
ncbi:MAG: MBL fold metallo-hydrolase [Alphaproteobacteria bacterium]|nr:MBL fold metallo-hydrolase [Alphaproteobacteria bacterium]